MAQQHDPVCALDRLRLREEPAQLRRRPQQRKEGRRHRRSEQRDRAVRAVPHEGGRREGGELLERPRLFPQPPQLVGLQDGRSRTAQRRLSHAHDRLGIRIRQRSQQEPVDDAEGRRVGADADGQDDYRGQREAGACGKLSPGLARSPRRRSITDANALVRPETCGDRRDRSRNRHDRW